MSNLAKNADYSTSDDDEDDESESEEEEQPKAVKGRVDAKVQQRNLQDEEESSEEEEDSETDNDAQRYNTVRREGTTAAPAKAAIASNPVAKRGRDGEGKDEEPAPKKSKETKGEKGRAPAKPASPPRASRSDPSSKGGKVQASKSKAERNKAAPAQREESAKPSAANKKRKASPPPANGNTKHDKNSPVKPKTPFTWTSNLEVALATMLWNDKKHGRPIPSGSKNDPYWGKLVKELSSEGVVITEAQLSEKVRRMKNKYRTFKAKEGDAPWKNAHEQHLFGIWDIIWGTGTVSGKQPARPATSQIPPNEEEEEEESSEEEEVATPVVRVSRGVAQPSRNEESSESEEEEDITEVLPRKGATGHDANAKEGTPFPSTTFVSPFISKPRLEYTPIVPRDDKKKASRKGEDVSIAEQSGAEASGEEDSQGRTSTAVVELVNSLKKESFAILHEVRASCLDALDNIRKQTTTVLDDMKEINGRLGVNVPTASGMWKMNGGSVPSLDRVLLEDFMTTHLRSAANAANSSLAAEVKSHWRQLRVEEMDLLEKRIELTLKQLQLARKEFAEQEN